MATGAVAGGRGLRRSCGFIFQHRHDPQGQRLGVGGRCCTAHLERQRQQFHHHAFGQSLLDPPFHRRGRRRQGLFFQHLRPQDAVQRLHHRDFGRPFWRQPDRILRFKIRHQRRQVVRLPG